MNQEIKRALCQVILNPCQFHLHDLKGKTMSQENTTQVYNLKQMLQFQENSVVSRMLVKIRPVTSPCLLSTAAKDSASTPRLSMLW